MDETKAKKILGDIVQEDNTLYCLGHYVNWSIDDDEITLDDGFTADELDALAWWMRNKGALERDENIT